METLLRPRPGESDGSLTRLIRERDWSATALGAPEGWPLPLRTLMGVMLGSNQPMFVAWGPERTLIYNNPYAEILARKHPEALGRPFLDVWHEIRGDLVPIVERAYAGEAVQMDDITLMMERRGYREETHFAFSYTPVRDEGGMVAGFFCVCQEITGQVLAERRLRESEARLRFLSSLDEALRASRDAPDAMQAATELLARHLGASRCAYADVDADNDRFVIRSDYTVPGLESSAGTYSLDLFGSRATADMREGRTLVIRDIPAELAPADGREMFLSIGISAIVCCPLVKDGRLVAMMAVHQSGPRDWRPDEIALVEAAVERCWAHVERVGAEARLRESDVRAREEAERVRLALDAGAIIGTWVWELPADRFTVDEAFARSFGLDPALGREGLSFEQVVATVHPDDLPGLQAAMAEAIARGGPYAHQYRVRRADGRYYWIEANGRVDHGPDGTPLRFPGVLLDVEERRGAEAERDRAQKLLESFVEAVPGVAYAKDREGRMLVANRGTTQLIGKPPEEYLGKTDAEFLDDPEQARIVMENDRRIMASGETEQIEEVVSLPDGTPAVWFSTKAPLRDEGRRVVGLIGSSIDITARKRTEAALAESEERFRNMADHAPVMMWVTDETGSCTYLNRVWYDFTGQAEAEALGLGWLEATHPDDKAEAGRIFLKATAAREPFRIEYRLRRADGAWRWAIDAAAPRFSPGGGFLGFIGSVIDITDRKEAEEELRARTAELESLLVSAPVGIAFFDREHRWARINEELAAINGFPVEEHLGRRMEELLPVNAGFVGPVLDRVFATGEAVRNVEVTGEVPHAPGVPRHWLVNYYPVVDAQGAVTMVGTWVVDITERKSAEERLLESEERYRTLFETIESGFCIVEVDLEGAGGRVDYRVVEANPAFYRQTGFPEAILGRWLREAAPGLEEHWFETYGRVARTGEPARFEQGSAHLGRWFDVYAFRQGEPGEGRVGILFNDISARRNAEEALRELNETLESRIAEAIAAREQAEEALRQSQKMEAVGQLTGGIAHDFNNMLAAVVGSLDLLGRRVGADDARSRRYVDAAMEGAKRAANLTQRLLAFSRQQPLKPEPVDANRLVAGMSDLLQRSLGAAVRLETVLAGGLWKAHADPNQLENVLLNLAVNARDAMPEGGRLTIETANAYLDSRYAAGHLGVPSGQYVQVSVTDTGHGMTPEVVAKAFDPFFTTKPVGQGTGLGLSQVYGFVKQSGGHVKIYSEPGHGTTVKIYLPRLLAQQAEEAAAEPPRELPRGEAQEVVLVVEDEAVVRQFTVDALGELGYRVLEADGAMAALRLLDAHPEVAVLFTDIVMPDTNGRKLADEALRRRPDLRVLFTTGYTRNAVVHNGVLDPGVHLLGKPFTVEQLAAKLREVLEAPLPRA